jgi:hypothetical protein
MVAAAHFLAGGYYDSSEGGKRALWYVIILVVGIVVEGIALKAPAVGSALTKHLDDHKATIIGGFALTIVLYLILEAMFG